MTAYCKDKRVIALAFSDLHLNMWAKFNQENKRTLDGFKVLLHVLKECKELGVPALFCGDLFHKPENIDQDLLNYWCKYYDKWYTKYGSVKVYAISGNHDMKNTSYIGVKPLSWVNILSMNDDPIFKSLDYQELSLDNTRVSVYGVPYIDHNTGLNDYLKKLKLKEGKNILMLHTDYPGARDTDERLIDSVENLNINILSKFDLVLCGHIHKPQRLSKKVYMLGAPIQQRRTDRDCIMGYWKVFSDMTLKFVPLEGFPKFIDVATPDEVKDDGNYYTVVPQKVSEKVITTHKITKQLSKKKLAHKYMKAVGMNDRDKENLLIDILKRSEE